MERKTMTVKEMAAYLSVHIDTIYKMTQENKLPHFRIGRKILFSQQAVDAWIHEQVRR